MSDNGLISKILLKKMNKKICIIGYGSIGRRHYEIISRLTTQKNIIVITKQLEKFNFKKDIKFSIDFNPDYFIISNETFKHENSIKFIEKNFKNKEILVEKPLFNSPSNLKIKKNNYYVGYNLRFNPILQEIKKKIKNKKILNVNILCGSFLPNWRSNINYTKSYSSSKKKGGGILFELSHELDFINWLFGKYKTIFSNVSKKSNLKISADDSADLILKNQHNCLINLSMNLYSKLNYRFIIVNCEYMSIIGDLIENTITISTKNNVKEKKYKLSKNYTYENQLSSFFSNKKHLCTFEEGKYINNKIYEIEKLK